MTDKQIIVDGVDVSGCKHYEDHTLYDCNETCEINGGIICTKCKDNHNCHYKNWKRKEQECERLKLDLIEAKAHGNYLNNLALSETLNLVSEEFDQLKADYKQLEITCEDFKKCINKQRNAKIQLSKLKDKQYKEFCDMKQALVKVKNMVEKSRDELYHCDSIIYADDRLVEMLYVINEVLPYDNQQ